MTAADEDPMRALLDLSPEEAKEFRRIVEEFGPRRVLEHLRQARAEREGAPDA